jgi:hypothetical protein
VCPWWRDRRLLADGEVKTRQSKPSVQPLRSFSPLVSEKLSFPLLESIEIFLKAVEDVLRRTGRGWVIEHRNLLCQKTVLRQTD